MITTPICMKLIKNPHNYKKMIIISYVGYFLLNCLMIPAMASNNPYLICFSLFLGGFFNQPTITLVLELACEIAFPISNIIIAFLQKYLNFINR
jgi:hypothetical protein